MTKKALALLLALIMVLSLAACGTKTESTAPSDAGTAPEEDAAPEEPAVEPINLRFGMNFVSNHPIVAGFEAMAERLEERTNGAVTLTLYPGEQLGNTNDCVNAVSTDTLDLAIGGVGMVSSRLPALKIFDCPYIFRDAEHLVNFSYSDVAGELWDQLAGESNLRFVGVIYNGARYLTMSNTPVTTPEDLNGMKLRVPDEPMGLAYGKAMGGNPTPMTFGEVYMGLQQGVIDGQENPLTNIIDGRLYEVQKYIIPTGHVLATQASFMSEASYQRIPEEYRAIFQEEFDRTCAELTQQILDMEAENLQYLLDQGMELVEPDIEAFKEACAAVVDQFKGEWGEDMYDIVQGF